MLDPDPNPDPEPEPECITVPGSGSARAKSCGSCGFGSGSTTQHKIHLSMHIAHSPTHRSNVIQPLPEFGGDKT
jgi:hypothetical protein